MVRKATDQEIIETYKELGNIWKVSKRFQMCGQSVHERLKRLHVPLKKRPLSHLEKNLIQKIYEKGFLRGDKELKNLSIQIGRTIPFISRKAREMGLTNPKRKHNEKFKIKNSENFKEWHKKNLHPKGMLGKTHTKKYSEECGKRAIKIWNSLSNEEKSERTLKQMKSRLKSQGTLAPKRGGADVSWKQGWRNIGEKEKYYRSRWEANYARYLEFLKIKGQIKEWQHEPQTFWFEEIKRGCRSYLPDFKIIKNDNSHYWVEVKGYYDAKSLTKIKRFRKYYPKETLILVDSVWFKNNSKKLSAIIAGWEISKI